MITNVCNTFRCVSKKRFPTSIERAAAIEYLPETETGGEREVDREIFQLERSIELVFFAGQPAGASLELQ